MSYIEYDPISPEAFYQAGQPPTQKQDNTGLLLLVITFAAIGVAAMYLEWKYRQDYPDRK